MNNSSIEWTDATWNPVSGCSHVSEGCRNCYAETIAKRFGGKNGFPEFKPWSAQNSAHNVVLHPERLDQPLRWKKPRRIFVNSMSDLFHESIPAEFIWKCFDMMSHAGWRNKHTFQVLTKRPERMKQFIEYVGKFLDRTDGMKIPWPSPYVWLGVSVEDQKTADERIPLLLQTPAAIRFVSYEPALGPVDFTRVVYDRMVAIDSVKGLHGWPKPHAECSAINWLIIGGESGPKARPCNVEWIRSAVRQCKEAGIACFVKQLGSNPILDHYEYRGSYKDSFAGDECHSEKRISADLKLKNRKGGDPSEWPEDLRVREFPQ